MRLVPRRREDDVSLGEAEVYAHSYGEHVSDHVDPVPAHPPQRVPEIAWEVDSQRHVTSEGLKRQFEERLQARKRRSSNGR